MADEGYLRVVTTALQTEAVVKSIEAIDGVKEGGVRVDRDSGKLVVAIEGDRGSILRQIGDVRGVIFVGPVGE